jgi:hypothetical protein
VLFTAACRKRVEVTSKIIITIINRRHKKEEAEGHLINKYAKEHGRMHKNHMPHCAASCRFLCDGKRQTPSLAYTLQLR